MGMYGTRNPELVLKAFFRSKAIALLITCIESGFKGLHTAFK
jgi:hypothetical protein